MPPTPIENNTIELQTILDKANALPDAPNIEAVTGTIDNALMEDWYFDMYYTDGTGKYISFDTSATITVLKNTFICICYDTGSVSPSISGGLTEVSDNGEGIVFYLCEGDFNIGWQLL